MRKVWMMMFTTIDGVAEFPVYPEDASKAQDDSEQSMWTPRMKSIDTLFLGRKTYEKWASYWPLQLHDPDANPFMRSFSAFADRASKVVFSKSLKKADWKNSRIVRGDISREVTRLKKLKGGDMAVGGGPRLAQSFLEKDLVDELMLEVFPSLLGKGRPLFHLDADPDREQDFIPLGVPGRRDFKIVEARVTPDGSLLTWYRRAR